MPDDRPDQTAAPPARQRRALAVGVVTSVVVVVAVGVAALAARGGGAAPATPIGSSAPPGTPDASTESTATTGPSTSTSVAPTTTTSTVPAPPRVVDAAHPLRVWVGGDSLAYWVGESLRTLTGPSGVVDVSVDHHSATGLARPDYFDWPAYLRSVLPSASPDVAVMMLGANDGQGFVSDGVVLPFGTAGWQAEYHRRVGATMDLLARRATDVYWIGEPVMRSSGLDADMRLVDLVFAAEAASRPHVHYVDPNAVLVGPDGRYTVTRPDASGNDVVVRSPDGVHLTRAGGDLVAREVLRPLAARWQLPALAGA